MSKKPLAILAGVVLVSLGSLGLWRWGPLADDQVVPSCGDLAEALPSAVEGSWTLTRTEPTRAVSRSVVRCEFGFRSADQSYWGKVVLDLSAGDDEAALRKKATDGPCYGEAVPNPSGAKYKVARACSQKISDKAFAGVFVASDERYAHTLAEFSSSSLPPEQVVAYANSSAQRIIDRAMALKASD
ncbi:hypothetical protein ONA70_00445 [Micromonospora yasonensis]|uniref:hypothetical protein n=1 Tax=Micromonospora yasonensis TaxID=1128667 RepID=UPI00222EC482|nr:hypothetical protein [Micromonospora yasonensis]MCW3838570.1 hypothetical protein [Micromonospora yasonensis]